MARAVERVVPPTPDISGIESAGRRALRLRRVAFAVAACVVVAATGLVVSSVPETSADFEPVAGLSWTNPEVDARISLPGRPTSIVSDGDDLWVGLYEGRLLKIDPATNEIEEDIEVGGGIIEIAAYDDTVWVAGTRPGVELSANFGGYHVDTIYEVDGSSGDVSIALEVDPPSNTRMVAGPEGLFFIANTNGSNSGKVVRFDPSSGGTAELGISGTSLALHEGTLWVGGASDVKRFDAASGELLGSTDSSDRGSDLMEGCSDCAPPPRAVVVGAHFAAHVPLEAGVLNVLEPSGEWLYQTDTHTSGSDASLALDGGTVFIRLGGRRIGVFDLSERKMTATVVLPDAESAYGPMTVAAGSLWVPDYDGRELVRISDGSVPSPQSSVIASASSTPEASDSSTPTPGADAVDPPEGPEYESSGVDENGNEVWYSAQGPGGFTVTFPPRWKRAKQPTTELAEPRELLTLSTVPVDEGGECAPGVEPSDLSTNDGLIFLTERRESPDPNDFPPRPDTFAAEFDAQSQNFECWLVPTTNFLFRDEGRYFQVSVALGDPSDNRLVAEVTEILDSLRFPAAE